MKRWIWWLLGGLMLVAVIGSALTGVVLRQISAVDFLGTTSEDELGRTDIERLLDAQLPPSAANVYSYYTSFQDYYAMIRFEIDPADLPQLLARSPFSDPLNTTNNPFQAKQNEPSWWQPHNARQFQWGQTNKNSEDSTILIDTTDPQRYIVYWHGIGT